MDNRPPQERKLHDYLHVLRRRKWIALQAVVLLPLVAVVLSLRQERLHQASAQVLLSRDDLAAALTGTLTPAAAQQPERLVETQADLARVSAVARRVLAAAGAPNGSVKEFLRASSVTAKPEADLLTFRVRDEDPERAKLLVTAYARQFTIYRRELDTAAIVNARRGLRERIARYDTVRERRLNLYATLVAKEDQLRTMEALKTSNATLVQAGEQAVQVQPRPVRNGILGLALGVILGVALAFLRDALDTRVRSADEVSARLGMPLLARIPEPARRLRNEDGLVMLEEPNGHHAEAFRMLRTNLEFVNLGQAARTIMVTSATAREGKSTTVGNLAVALARAGKHVVAVDLDLRRPYLGRFFGVQDHPGITEVVLGHVQLEQAIASVAIPTSRPGERPSGGNGAGALAGILEIVPSGPLPPAPGEFVGLSALSDAIRRLSARADFVLIDSPPLLQVGDALTLSTRVDAIVAVARLELIGRPMLTELHRALEKSPAAKLGFVLAGAELEEGYYGYATYGDYYASGDPALRSGRMQATS
jgi:succinoglycan biosynthesis transport protein ExoP